MEIRSALSTPTTRDTADLRRKESFSSLSEKPNSMIGPIRGEISMAPMITAGEDKSRPSVAIAQDMTIMKI